MNRYFKIHELKTWPEFFEKVKKDRKRFEIRKNDRDFKEGDILVLREYDNELKKYTGESVRCVVLYVLTGGAFGIEEGYVVMTIVIIPD